MEKVSVIFSFAVLFFAVGLIGFILPKILLKGVNEQGRKKEESGENGRT